MKIYPDASELSYDIELLFYAVRMWRVSGSALPPLPHELLYRDRAWDADTALVRDAIDYMIAKKEGKISDVE